MPLHKLTIKLFASNDTFAPDEFVPVFHRWIQTQSLADHLLIDVADYAHVPQGPGSLVVASEANIQMDRGGGRLGLMYVRKQPIAGATTFGQTLKGVFGYALAAALKMQEDEFLKGRLTFRTDEIAVGFNDRLQAPNSPDTIAEYHPLVTAFFSKVFPGEKPSIEPRSKSPRELIELRVRSSRSASLETLIERVKAITA